MHINNTPEPRIPGIENLELLDLMGVIPSPSYDTVQRQSAIGSMPPAAYPSFLTIRNATGRLTTLALADYASRRVCPIQRAMLK
jgi:hypothetical protein